jgi:hypothetical protein
MFEGMLYAEKSRSSGLTVAQEIVGICSISRADWAVSFAPGCYLQLYSYPYSYFYFYLHMYVCRYVCMHACM